MTQNRLCRAAMTPVAVGCALLLLGGCQGPRRGAHPVAEPGPNVQPEAPIPAPAAPAPTTAPSPAPPVALKPDHVQSDNVIPSVGEPALEPFESPKPPPAAAEQLPSYIQVVERIRASEPVQVHVDTSSPQRLVIETRNVRRLRIDREHAPLALNRSVVLRLDGQGIEWTADSRTHEFERSTNGEWEALHERKP